MAVTLDGISGLRALRCVRANQTQVLPGRFDLRDPILPPGRRRWSASALELELLPGEWQAIKEHPLRVLAATHAGRIQSSVVCCSVYETPLPPGSVVNLVCGHAMACPELLFYELWRYPVTQALVGYELCGTYARDPTDPRDGPVTFGTEPVTSVARIAGYLKRLGPRRGVRQARRALSWVRDNAWSPAEAVVALLAVLPTSWLGYELGDIVLNRRLDVSGARSTRVPDIMFVGTGVGINYDGDGHLNLDSIAMAESCEAVSRAQHDVRHKYVDDRRRDRELAAVGRNVCVVMREDLYEEGGFDRLVRNVMDLLRLDRGWDLIEQRKLLQEPDTARRRQQLVWSLLAGDRARQCARWYQRYMSQARPPCGRGDVA